MRFTSTPQTVSCCNITAEGKASPDAACCAHLPDGCNSAACEVAVIILAVLMLNRRHYPADKQMFNTKCNEVLQ
jgi:hypothetical protein